MYLYIDHHNCIHTDFQALTQTHPLTSQRDMRVN